MRVFIYGIVYAANQASGKEVFFVARRSLFPPYGGHYRRVEEMDPCRVYAPETAGSSPAPAISCAPCGRFYVARMEGEVIGKQ